MSAIGLGTVKLGRNTGLKHSGPFSLPSDDEARQLLATAADLGITLIDTAPAYGTSEERLGKLLPKIGGRDRWILSTKVGEEYHPTTQTSRYDFTPEAVWKSVERSLKRLHTDRIDLVLVHSDGNDLPIIHSFGTLDALRDLKAAGQIRAYGMSTKTLEGALLAADRCDAVMLTLNPRDRQDMPAIAEAARHGTGVLIKKAMLSGHVAEVAAALSDRPELARLPAADACVRFAAQTPGVSSVVLGTLNPEHLKSAVAAIA